MVAPFKNQFWKLRSKHGRDKLFTTPELLWDAACAYFQWCEDNHLAEEKVFQYQGEIVRAEVRKMRAMTLSGMCFYLHCSESYFRAFKSTCQEKDKDILTVIDDIETIIYNQKFAGASADLLNANIISRDLGLMDKQGIDLSYNLEHMSDEQLTIISNNIINATRNENNKGSVK
jgi:hypothetical protein